MQVRMALRAANRPIREWHVCVPTLSANSTWTLEAKFRADDLSFHELIPPRTPEFASWTVSISLANCHIRLQYRDKAAVSCSETRIHWCWIDEDVLWRKSFFQIQVNLNRKLVYSMNIYVKDVINWESISLFLMQFIPVWSFRLTPLFLIVHRSSYGICVIYGDDIV